jgi:hypothetical protein
MLKVKPRIAETIKEMTVKQLIDEIPMETLLELVNQLTGGSADRKVVEKYIGLVRRDGVWLSYYPENRFIPIED